MQAKLLIFLLNILHKSENVTFIYLTLTFSEIQWLNVISMLSYALKSL